MHSEDIQFIQKTFISVLFLISPLSNVYSENIQFIQKTFIAVHVALYLRMTHAEGRVDGCLMRPAHI